MVERKKMHEGMLLSDNNVLVVSVNNKRMLLMELKRHARIKGWPWDEIQNATFVDSDDMAQINKEADKLNEV